MKKNLTSYTLLLLFMVSAGIITIGGLSLFLVNTMMDKMYLVEKESKNVRRIHQIHDQTNKLLITIQQFIIHPEPHYAQKVERLFADIEFHLQSYIDYEKQALYPEGEEEVRLLLLLQSTLEDIKNIHALALTQSPVLEKIRDLDRHATRIESLVREIDRLHFIIISRKVEKSHDRMVRVLRLYLFFSAGGLLFFSVIYRLYSLHVVKPIATLAAVTRQLAAGDLGIRVPTTSQTEIGVLYDSFNTMAEKLQHNENLLLNFNQELENKVRERTTELEKTQKELLRMERLATLGQVATSVNHEIKTPLNALSMNLQLLSKDIDRLCRIGTNGDNTPTETIRIIEGEVARISDILDEFVLYARFTPPVMAENDLNDLIRKVVAMISEKADKAGVHLAMHLDPGLPLLRLDENRIIQALINLCINAFQAMPTGGTLIIETKKTNNSAILTVTDNGSGIDAAHRDRIFQPFFSTKATGLGFGLPIVQKIIEDHEGRIFCTSNQLQGTRFEIRLPTITLAPKQEEQ